MRARVAAAIRIAIDDPRHSPSAPYYFIALFAIRRLHYSSSPLVVLIFRFRLIIILLAVIVIIGASSNLSHSLLVVTLIINVDIDLSLS